MTGAAGYSGTPLARKLGIKPGHRVRLLDAPDHYWSLFGGGPARLEVTVLPPDSDDDADVTHLFTTRLDSLREGLALARRGMAENGMVWVSWPKQASGVASDVGRAEVMAEGKAAGLVDVKVCAVDDTWSGLKFVIPVARRRTS